MEFPCILSLHAVKITESNQCLQIIQHYNLPLARLGRGQGLQGHDSEVFLHAVMTSSCYAPRPASSTTPPWTWPSVRCALQLLQPFSITNQSGRRSASPWHRCGERTATLAWWMVIHCGPWLGLYSLLACTNFCVAPKDKAKKGLDITGNRCKVDSVMRNL